MRHRRTQLLWFCAILAGTAAIEHAMGRSFLGPDGRFAVWEGNIWSSENSQRLFDPYSLTHLSHGFVFFGLLWAVARRLPVGTRFVLATLLEASWELLENSAFMIERYRQATIALGYTGDSVLNSLSDIVMMATAFLVTARIAPVIAVTIFALLELTCAMWFHDNLTLNVIMLVHPVEAVKTWQLRDQPAPQPSVLEPPEPSPVASPGVPELSEEPLFCTDPLKAICDKPVELNIDLKARIPDIGEGRFSPELLGKIREIEEASIIPSFEEAKRRIIESLDEVKGLGTRDREEMRKTLAAVRYLSPSDGPEIIAKLKERRKTLPETSKVRAAAFATDESMFRYLDFKKLSTSEKDFLTLWSRGRALYYSQNAGCGESIPLNAFSYGAQFGVPSVSLCMITALRFRPMSVEERYPVLAEVFGHELGHQIDSAMFPSAYDKYFRCLSVLQDPKSPDAREISAPFWAATTLGNVLKTRARLLEEPRAIERDRAVQFLRRALGWLCAVPWGGTHPSGDFQIKNIFGRDPGIRRVLGCRPRPACTLEGGDIGEL